MAGERIKAGEAYVAVTADDKGLKAGLQSAEKEMHAFRKKIDFFSAAVGASLFVGFMGVTAAAKNLTSALIGVGDQLDKMSQRTGVSVETLSKFSTMAQLCGADVGVFEKTLTILQKRIGEAQNGSAAANAAFRSLGLSLKDLSGLTPDQQFIKVAGKMGELSTQTKKAALSLAIFGKTGTQLIPFFNSGADGIVGMSKNLDRLGAVVSTNTATAAAKLLDALTLIKAQVSALSVEFMGNFADAFTAAANKIQDVFAAVIKFSNENRALVTGVTAATTSFLAMGTAVAVLPVLFGKASLAAKAFSLALTTIERHPVMAGLTVLTAITTGVIASFLAASNANTELSDSAEQAARTLKDQQKTETDLFNRLKELNSQTSLTNEEMEEADGIIQQLNGSYNDLGLSINKATGEIEGMTGAQKKLTEEQLKARKAALEAEIAEKKANRQAQFNRASNLQGEGWGNYLRTGFKNQAQRQEEIDIANAAGNKLGAEIREKELELEALNKATEERSNAPTNTATETGGMTGREASKAAEAFNSRLAGNVKDNSAEARKAELQQEADAILAPLIAERDEELTNAKRRNELAEQIAEIEENLQKNLDKIDAEEKARLDAEKATADAEEERRKVAEAQRDQQLKETAIGGTREEIANKEADLRGLYSELETASTQEEADRLAETIAKTNEEIAALRWKELGEELESAENAFNSAQEELNAARASGDADRLLSAQRAWERAYNDVTAAESAKEKAVEEYQRQMEDAYRAQLEAIDQTAGGIDYGLSQVATSRGGSFNAAAASAVANPVEQRVAKATEDSARYLRDILNRVNDFDGGEVVFA